MSTDQRLVQHRNVIEAAASCWCWFVLLAPACYMPITSSLLLAKDHVQTEALLKGSGIPYVLLRNGWYTENYTDSMGAALVHGAVPGSAGTRPHCCGYTRTIMRLRLRLYWLLMSIKPDVPMNWLVMRHLPCQSTLPRLHNSLEAGDLPRFAKLSTLQS